MLIVLSEQVDRKKEVIDVIENDCVLVGVLLLLRKERNWMFTPVTERIEVMRCVIAIVVTVAVALL
jgi:hypothetical protein